MLAPSPSQRLTPPGRYLIRMVVFLALCAFLVAILGREITRAFMANPGLNGLILGCLLIGVLLALWQVVRLISNVRWVNELRSGDADQALARTPSLMAPIATLLGDRAGRTAISPALLRSVLDSVAMRLDETREISRYLTGLLVFLGLLGTFWGLLETVSAVGGVIGALQGGRETSLLFDELKAGLQAPLAGMGISFSSSLFGLAGSLVLGFLDLQSGAAQNRFVNELEDWLATTTADITTPPTGDVSGQIERIARLISQQSGTGQGAAITQLAEGIQGLVQHMRQEQQLIRDWVEAQADQQIAIRRLLERLARETERR